MSSSVQVTSTNSCFYNSFVPSSKARSPVRSVVVPSLRDALGSLRRVTSLVSPQCRRFRASFLPRQSSWASGARRRGGLVQSRSGHVKLRSKRL